MSNIDVIKRYENFSDLPETGDQAYYYYVGCVKLTFIWVQLEKKYVSLDPTVRDVMIVADRIFKEKIGDICD